MRLVLTAAAMTVAYLIVLVIDWGLAKDVCVFYLLVLLALTVTHRTPTSRVVAWRRRS